MTQDVHAFQIQQVTHSHNKIRAKGKLNNIAKNYISKTIRKHIINYLNKFVKSTLRVKISYLKINEIKI